jgi:hypothetical protein
MIISGSSQISIDFGKDFESISIIFLLSFAHEHRRVIPIKPDQPVARLTASTFCQVAMLSA